MGTEDIKISVIIVNWNAGDLLLKCVRSIIADQDRSGLQNVEIVVIDNASSDGSINSIKLLYSKIGCIQNSENLGFAHANNQGIHSATGQYVLLLNPDTEIRPGALSEMVRFMESHPKVGAVGPMLLNNDGSLQISAYPEPSLFREMWRLFYFDGFLPIGSYPMNAWHPEIPREVDVLMGACILLRREVLSQCGLLDERYFIYSEDQDYCRRIRSGGWKIFWLPRAQVVHYGGQSTQQVKGDMFVRLYREKINYFRMHYGDSVATRYKILLLVASIIRLLLSPLALLKSSPQRSRACELARFYGRLVKELPAL
jgi:N-acetylglucosaminyl-diphospho-decaprenol L-rhamnosyltransferase